MLNIRCSPPAARGGGAAGLLASVGLVLLVALCYYVFNENIDYTVGHHSESSKKALFVLQGKQDFFHPILMLRTVGVASWLKGDSDPEQVLFTGRRVAALFGVGFVIAAFLLARSFLSPLTSLACAAAVAAAPLTVVHAHYFKEDIWLVPFTTLGVAALTAMVRKASPARSVVFGVAAGLAMSSKYIGALLLPLAYAVPWFAAQDIDTALFRRATGRAALAALAVFCMINLPLFSEFGTFAHGLSNELLHTIEGHHAKVLPFEYLWTFHLQKSLWPGMTPWLLIPGLAGLAWIILDWKRQPTTVRTLAMAAAGYYLLIETTPMKPFPDFMRYVLPLVPFLAVAAGMLLERLLAAAPWGLQRAAPFVIICLLSTPAYALSSRYNQALALDTRDVAGRILDQLAGPIVIERYTRDCLRVECVSLTEEKLGQTLVDFLEPDKVNGRPYRYAAISSFQYERIILSSSLWVHYPRHEKWAAYYKSLLSRPRLQISGVLPPLGFIDPTIQIIDLAGSKDELQRYVRSYGSDLIQVRFIDGGSSS